MTVRNCATVRASSLWLGLIPTGLAVEEIEVREKTGSTTMKRWDLLVARLNPLGPTGGPEIESR